MGRPPVFIFENENELITNEPDFKESFDYCVSLAKKMNFNIFTDTSIKNFSDSFKNETSKILLSINEELEGYSFSLGVNPSGNYDFCYIRASLRALVLFKDKIYSDNIDVFYFPEDIDKLNCFEHKPNLNNLKIPQLKNKGKNRVFDSFSVEFSNKTNKINQIHVWYSYEQTK